MKIRYLHFLLCALLGAMAFAVAAAAQDKDWRPVSQAEMQMAAPKVEADAEAEVLFWEVRVSDEYVQRSGFKSVLSNYIRIKVFNERGRDRYNKIEIPFGKISDLGVEVSVKDIAARTVKADGTTLEVKPTDIFEQETIKGRGIKWKSKSFVMPGVEVGSIIEYRWKEVRANALSFYVRLQFAREIPIQYVKYYIKPVAAPYFSLGMRVHSINTTSEFVLGKDQFYSTYMENVPSFKEEPFMPADYEIRPWVLVYYEDDDSRASAEKYWENRGKQTFKTHKEWLSPSNEIKSAAAGVIGDASDTDEKIRRIYEYCRKNITNYDDDASGLTAEQLKKVKVNRTVSDVLNSKIGSWHDIQALFGAMVVSTGTTVRVANVSSRTEPKFDKTLGNGFFNKSEIIAAKVGEVWKFYDPSSRYLPAGIIPWNVEGETALISDPEQPFFVKTSVTPPEQTRQKRTAALRLNEDGSVEGEVRIEFTGHLGRSYKEINDDSSAPEREKSLIGLIKRITMDSAEVTAVSIDNVTDAEKPFTYAFHIRLPSYAEKTGKRIFLQPNIFEHGTTSKFTQSKRRYDISFDYAWSELDEITFELPRGYTAEPVQSPPKIIDNKGNTSLETKYEFSGDKTILKYARSFSLGNKAILDFSTYGYSSIKDLFESIHKTDTQGIVLLKNG